MGGGGKGPEAGGRGLAPAARGYRYLHVYFQSVGCSEEGGAHGAGSLYPVVCVLGVRVRRGRARAQAPVVRPKQESALKVAEAAHL